MCNLESFFSQWLPSFTCNTVHSLNDFCFTFALKSCSCEERYVTTDNTVIFWVLIDMLVDWLTELMRYFEWNHKARSLVLQHVQYNEVPLLLTGHERRAEGLQFSALHQKRWRHHFRERRKQHVFNQSLIRVWKRIQLCGMEINKHRVTQRSASRDYMSD